MAGYPYTGGIYGGYSDPANNKKKTFIGPKADQALSKLPGTYKANPDVGASTVSEAGNANPLAQTPKGYPHIGLSTPAAPPRSPREMLLNIPGNNGQPPVIPAEQPQTPVFNEKLMPSHAPSINGAVVPAQSQPQPQQKFKATFDNGMVYEGDNQGNRTYTMGTQGQDGYGKMTAHARQAREQLSGVPQGYERRGNMTVDPNRGIYAQTTGGLSVASTDPDAVARFSAPITTPPPMRERFVRREEARPEVAETPLAQPPKYMTREEGKAAGIGWKGRMSKYNADMAAYNQAIGNTNAINVEQMRESGADRRSQLQAQGTRDANSIARQRLTGELGLNDARIRSEGINQQKGQMEVDQAKKMQDLNDRYLAEADPAKSKVLGNKILTMQGKDPKEWQITTREDLIDPTNPMAGTIKRPYAVNLNDPTQAVELGGDGGGVDPVMAEISRYPQYLEAYKKASPKHQQEMLLKLRQRMAQERK